MWCMFRRKFLNAAATGKKFRKLSKYDFRFLGETEVAYIKQITEGGFLILSADGTPIGFSDNRSLAELAIVDHNLNVVTLQ